MSFPYFRYDTRKEIVLLIESTTRGPSNTWNTPLPLTTTRKDVLIYMINQISHTCQTDTQEKYMYVIV